MSDDVKNLKYKLGYIVEMIVEKAKELGMDLDEYHIEDDVEKVMMPMVSCLLGDMLRKCEFAEAKNERLEKKIKEMVTAAEDLLVGTGWLPEPLRTPPLPEEDAPEIELVDETDRSDDDPSEDDPDSSEAQSAEDGGEPAIGDSDPMEEDDPVAGDAFAKTAAE